MYMYKLHFSEPKTPCLTMLMAKIWIPLRKQFKIEYNFEAEFKMALGHETGAQF